MDHTLYQPAVGPVKVTTGFMRLHFAGPLEFCAEQLLARRHNFDLAVFRGRQAVTDRGRSGAYRVINPLAALRSMGRRVDELHLSDWGRFGNACIQLTQMFYMAERFGSKTLRFPGAHPFFTGARSGDIDLRWDGSRLRQDRRPGLLGPFYYLNAFRTTCGPEDYVSVSQQRVAPLLTPFLRKPHPDVAPDDLVLHFRAGDIFNNDEVHPGYGQPPVSYYLKAVEAERPKRVWAVYEDRGNPAVDAVENALRERGIEVIMQSGELAEDLHILMSARRLVLSRGTFVPEIAILSNVLERLYGFDQTIPAVRWRGVEMRNILDRRGDYVAAVLAANWRKTPEQYRLMLDYPADALDMIIEPPSRGRS